MISRLFIAAVYAGSIGHLAYEIRQAWLASRPEPPLHVEGWVTFYDADQWPIARVPVVFATQPGGKLVSITDINLQVPAAIASGIVELADGRTIELPVTDHRPR